MSSIGNIKNIPVVVGGFSPNNKNVEHFENGNWIVQPDFPFVSEYIYQYSMATLNDNLYLFGTQNY